MAEARGISGTFLLIAAEHATPAGGRVPATGARRRLQALAWHGHSASRLGPLLGVPVRALVKTRAGDGPRTISAATADVVRRRFHGLLTVPGDPAVAGKARAAGWAPEAAWDDIDDPAETPQGVPPRDGHPTAGREASMGPSQPI